VAGVVYPAATRRRRIHTAAPVPVEAFRFETSSARGLANIVAKFGGEGFPPSSLSCRGVLLRIRRGRSSLRTEEIAGEPTSPRRQRSATDLAPGKSVPRRRALRFIVNASRAPAGAVSA